MPSVPSQRLADNELQRLKLLLLSSVKPTATEWLWRDRIPLGELTVIDGDPGTNKSSMLLDLAARVSAGRAMPGETDIVEGGVLLLAGEDSVAKTVVRRLVVAQANLDRIAVIDQQVVLPKSISLLEEAV